MIIYWVQQYSMLHINFTQSRAAFVWPLKYTPLKAAFPIQASERVIARVAPFQ